MVIKVTRPQLKKLINSEGKVTIYIGNIHNGIFWSGCYLSEVCSIEEAEQAMSIARTRGWSSKLYFGIDRK